MDNEERYGAIPGPTGGGGSGLVSRAGGGGSDADINRSLNEMSDRYRKTAAGLAIMESSPQTSGGGSNVTQVIAQPSRQAQADPYAFLRQPSRQSSSSRSYSVGSAGGPGVILDRPLEKPTFQATPYPDVPKYVAPEYKPPEEDKGYERAKRQELVGNQAAQLRQATSEQMLQNRSIDNPALRRQLAGESVKGYGQALGSIYDTSARTAMAAGQQKRRDDMAIYNAKHSVLSGEAMINYKNEVNSLVQNWMQEAQAARDEYAIDLANYQAQPLAQRVGQDTPQNSRIAYGLRLA